jgi:hypothetical protein
MIECSLLSSGTQTAYGPLCAFGHHLTRNEVLKPLEWVDVRQKTVDHSPAQKLTDALIGILAGCSALYELNVLGCAPMYPYEGLSAGGRADAPSSRPSPPILWTLSRRRRWPSCARP